MSSPSCDDDKETNGAQAAALKAALRAAARWWLISQRVAQAKNTQPMARAQYAQSCCSKPYSDVLITKKEYL